MGKAGEGSVSLGETENKLDINSFLLDRADFGPSLCTDCSRTDAPFSVVVASQTPSKEEGARGKANELSVS